MTIRPIVGIICGAVMLVSAFALGASWAYSDCAALVSAIR